MGEVHALSWITLGIWVESQASGLFDGSICKHRCADHLQLGMDKEEYLRMVHDGKCKCTACEKSSVKVKRRPKLKRREKKVGEMIHIDPSGKVQRPCYLNDDPRGIIFFYLLTDEASRYICVAFTDKKSDFLPILQSYMIYTRFNIEDIHVDKGSELNSKNVRDW